MLFYECKICVLNCVVGLINSEQSNTEFSVLCLHRFPPVLVPGSVHGGQTLAPGPSSFVCTEKDQLCASAALVSSGSVWKENDEGFCCWQGTQRKWQQSFPKIYICHLVGSLKRQKLKIEGVETNGTSGKEQQQINVISWDGVQIVITFQDISCIVSQIKALWAI